MTSSISSSGANNPHDAINLNLKSPAPNKPPAHAPVQQSASQVGQNRAQQMRSGREVFNASMAQLSEDAVPVNSAGATDISIQNKRADRITPDHLKAVNLSKLPVYMVARGMGDGSGKRRMHGFVAIGFPGYRGAKVYSYGSTNRHSQVKLDRTALKAVKDAQNKWGQPLFINDTQQALRNMRKNAPGKSPVYRTFQDFHRAFYIEQMRIDQQNNDPKSMTPEAYKKHVLFMQNWVNREALKLHDLLYGKHERSSGIGSGSVSASTSGIGSVSGNASSSGGVRYGMEQNRPQMATELYQTTVTQKDLKYPLPEDLDGGNGDAKKANQYKKKQIPARGMSLAEQDARFFENPDAHDHVTLKPVKDVQATDVIEAQRQQWTAQNFLDEKARILDQSTLAPELALPLKDVNIPDNDDDAKKKAAQELKQAFETQLKLAEDYYKEKSYAPVQPGPLKKSDPNKIHPRDNQLQSDLVKDPAMPVYAGPGDNSPGLSKAATHNKRRYKVAVVTPKKENDFSKKVSFLAKWTPISKNRLANDGNCNSAAGSLLRNAARLRGKEIDVQGGPHQHGHSKDILWNPIPNFKRPQQTQEEFVAQGSRSAEELKEEFAKLSQPKDQAGQAGSVALDDEQIEHIIAGNIDDDRDDLSSSFSMSDDNSDYSNSLNPQHAAQRMKDPNRLRTFYQEHQQDLQIEVEESVSHSKDQAPQIVRDVQPQSAAVPPPPSSPPPLSPAQAQALEATTLREIQSMKNNVAVLDSAYKNLAGADKMMMKYTPRPTFRLNKELFEPVRKAMKEAINSAQKNDSAAMTQTFHRLGVAAANFKSNRMKRFVKLSGRPGGFNTSSANLQTLQSRLDRKFKQQGSGIKKMLISDFVSENVYSMRTARNEIMGSLLKTLSKKPAELTKAEVTKLQVAADLLGKMNFPDPQLSKVLRERAVDAQKAHAAAMQQI